ncbi:MAG: sigma-70 family RNA polymerase sigma factor [Bacteroidales bacterium]|nr:sigma-70 family RNA polymerase sigma factor [Bacteroidales bacterium]
MNENSDRVLADTYTDIHREVIELSKTGDRLAQYKLYQLYSKAMYNICLRMVCNREEAEDVLQDSFADAFHRLKSFRHESSFGAWLKRIVINHCINYLKKKRAGLEYFEDMSQFDSTGEEQGKKGDEHYEMTVGNIRKAMEHLPDGSRMIFSLYLLEGYDHREIAQILKISESNSKSQYMRARNRVKELLIKMNHEN